MSSNAPLTQRDIAQIAERLDRPVVLVGLMGVGKSTVGRRLASMLGRQFVDADDEIEIASQRSIPEIFAEHGEAYFRDGERRVIARLIEEDAGVIATGGGAFIDPETRALILTRAVAVWINCDIDTLVERTSRRSTRPLLQTGDPKEILTELLKKRQKFYEQAQLHVQSQESAHSDTARAIIEAIDQWM